jgi:Malectin domain
MIVDAVASATSTGVFSGAPADDRCRAELAAVLSSAHFRRSPKLSRLLRYLCDKQLDGLGGEITEYSIAVDVLGRHTHFDPQQSAAVRVATLHLRKRLKEYYADAGRDHEIRLVIPNGQYAPEFVQCRECTSPEKAMLGNRKWLIAALALAVLGGALAVTHRQQIIAPLAARAKALRAAPAISQGELEEIRIRAGDGKENYIDVAGRTWLSDRYFTGGTTFHRNTSQIRRTQDPDLFRTGREGQFLYAIPLRPASYELHLYFAETGVASEAQRSVDISINGKPVSPLDVASDAGGVNTATVKIFRDVSPGKDGYLRLMFQGAGPSFLNAIEILPGIPGKIRPIRLTARDNIFCDHLGQAWLPDRWAAGGRKSTRIVPIANTSDPGLYQSLRFGHFSYSIPVAEGGRYTVVLHFSETWFTPPNSSAGIGARVFDVYCNGSTLLKNFDILREAEGNANRAVTRVFRHVPASPLGKIDLDFVPVANYALINAIEVMEE